MNCTMWSARDISLQTLTAGCLSCRVDNPQVAGDERRAKRQRTGEHPSLRRSIHHAHQCNRLNKVARVTLFISSLLQMQANPCARHTQVSCMVCAYDVGLLLMSRRKQQYHSSESSLTLQAECVLTAALQHPMKLLNRLALLCCERYLHMGLQVSAQEAERIRYTNQSMLKHRAARSYTYTASKSKNMVSCLAVS
jgi:hypothetical protein